MIKLLLVLSLAVNVLLGVLYYRANSASAVPVEAVAATAVAPKSASSTSVITLAGKTNVLDWQSVESGDYKEYIANLRKIGCPEETIRDIIVADVDKLFESKRKAIAKKKPPVEFWKTGMQMFTAQIDQETIKQRQELRAERRALIKELLGTDVPDKPEMANLNPLGDLLDFLPESKQSELVQAMERFQAKALEAVGKGTPDSEDMKNLQKIQKEMDEELARILTPEQKEQYDLRLSNTAMIMRMQLGAFEPNEQEFREIFKLQKKFDDEHGLQMGRLSTEDQASRKVAQEDLNKQLKEVLGDRYQDYELSKSPTYSALHKISQRHEIPSEKIKDAYAAKKAMEQELRNLRDRELSAEQRKEITDRIAVETQNHVRRTLGDAAYEAYIKQGGSDWAKGPKKPAQ